MCLPGDGFVDHPGPVLFYDTGQSLQSRNHPYNLFVATFIGTPQMNLFENAKLVKENGKYFVKLDALTVELSAEKQEKLAKNNVESQDIVLGVRPEHITLEA